MMELLNRINALAVRNKEVGLTPAELQERDQLRQQYLQQIHGQVLANINSFTLVDEFGQDVTPEKIKEYKSNQFYPALTGSNLSVPKAKRQVQDSHLKEKCRWEINSP